MRAPKLLAFFLLSFFLISCGEGEANFKLNFANDPLKFHLGDTLKVSVENTDQKPIDSVVYFYGKKRLQKTNGNEALSFQLENLNLGNHVLTARVYSEGDQFEAKKTIKLLYNKKPVIYTYEIVNTYPHDIDAYTQGLNFYNATIYESTGHHGASSLLKTYYKTGEVL